LSFRQRFFLQGAVVDPTGRLRVRQVGSDVPRGLVTRPLGHLPRDRRPLAPQRLSASAASRPRPRLAGHRALPGSSARGRPARLGAPQPSRRRPRLRPGPAEARCADCRPRGGSGRSRDCRGTGQDRRPVPRRAARWRAPPGARRYRRALRRRAARAASRQVVYEQDRRVILACVGLGGCPNGAVRG